MKRRRVECLYLLLVLCTNGFLSQDVAVVINVVENLQPPVTIGSLALSSSSASSYTVIEPTVIDDLPGKPAFDDIFNVQANGDVIAKVKLDRELKSSYRLLVASDTGELYVAEIRIMDLNDNSPAFNPSSLNITVPESSQPGVQLHLLGSAIDPDQGINSTQRYEIISGSNGMFKLEETQVGSSDVSVVLKLNGTLDYETKKQYQLVVRAFDGGGRSGDLTVNIAVTDANDIAPQFLQNSYSVDVNENSKIGDVVLTVKAEDPEEGLNGVIEYELSSEDSSPNFNHFAVNKATGDVTVQHSLDFLFQKAYRLRIIAINPGSTLKSSTVVNIAIINVNDQAPEITVNRLIEGAILENVAKGTNLVRLSISDADQEDGNFTVTLSDTGGTFVIGQSDADTFYIKLEKQLDREATSVYNLNITAWDNGVPPLWIAGPKKTIQLEIAVGDINDNYPRFKEAEYTLEIEELAILGSPVGNVTATDLDYGDNALISYKLIPIPNAKSDWFTIHNVSGMVQTAKEPIECSPAFTPSFYIEAKDHGNPALSSQVLVNVVVRDISDNAPVFNKSVYTVSISEDSSITTDIIQVTATDTDCGVSSAVTYSLSSGGIQAPSQFIINPNTGVISIKQALDYESKKIHEFPVFAFDRGGQSSSVNVKVEVTDANDNRPIFYPQAYVANIRLDTPVGATIIIVKATDADSGVLGNLSYTISAGNSADFFRVDEKSGELKLKASLGSSPPSTFQLAILATDGLGLFSEIPANVTITVLPNSAQAPVFSQNLYQFSIAESTSSNQAVGTVSATVQGSSQGVVYSIFSGDPQQYFSIAQETGLIMTTFIPADRERYDFVLLNIRAEKSGVFANGQVNITITDINDNKPEFSSSVTNLPLREDVSLNTAFYTVAASDADAGSNGRVRYQLTTNPDQMFDINPTSGVLSVKKQLDYEAASSYVLVVEAYDDGSPKQTNRQNITISLVDVNDNPPVFNQSVYELSLLELAPPLSQVGFVNATDRDSGKNGKVHYQIVGDQSVFGIYPSTGKIYNQISFSQAESLASQYTLEVRASDNGDAPKTTTCTVKIIIIDENDHAPQFVKPVFELSVSEAAYPGAEVGSVEATDKDKGDNAKITFSLPSDVTAFRINADNGKLYVKSAIDRETTPRYGFTVKAADGGDLFDEAYVKITVTDVNDNAPVFNGVKNGVIPAFINENKESDTLIVQVTAIDADEGENKRVTYTINGENQDKFVIDPLSGWIRSKAVFKKSVQAVYNVTVVAKDSGQIVRSTAATVQVRVLSENETPQFTASYLELSTDENIPIGTVIGEVRTYGSGSDGNTKMNFTALQKSTENAFDVNTTTGAVFSILPIDYEKVTSHWMIVLVQDFSKTEPQSTNINVTIAVHDKNDNVPIFVKDPLFITIAENVKGGTQIGQVSAQDADSGSNGEVLYEIVSQYPSQPASMFSINSKTGNITTASTIDYEKTTAALLVVKAIDQALNVSERTYSTMTVVVNIEDINDNVPVFQSRDEISIAEDEPVGYPVLVIAATDADKNSSVRYSIQSGDPDNVFALDSLTGELKLNAMLDRETTPEYQLTVKAVDTGNPPKHQLQTIKIIITDVNDNPPQFLNKTYTATVTEEQMAPVEVLTIHAVDPDSGNNAKLQYQIPSGLADDRFVVDNDGVIRTTAPLDRETKGVYTFNAYVRDSAFPALYDWCTITVTVVDINDHTPYFQHTEFFQTVPENLRDRNSSIFQVVAQDHDEGENARITYSITTGNEANKFSIDPNNGKIYAQSLDREQQERYTLTIQATDHGIPIRKNETRVIITVSDTNDNDPQFTNGGKNYAASLNETVQIGTYVTTISAMDPDKGNNSKITYYIASNGEDQGKFSLDMDTGVIRTAGLFDREKQDKYSFKVIAQDNAQYDPRTNQTWVEVTILDVNDNAPVFVEVPFVKNITGLETGTILTVRAEDKDEGYNGQVEYSITKGGEDFSINPTTGEIKIKSTVVGLSNLIRLEVRATDKGTPPLSSDGYVEIKIGASSGQQSFKFSNSTYNVYLDEDASNDDLVLKLTASHSGSPANDVTYSLSGDVAENNNPFSINNMNGEIRVVDSSKLDYELVKRYRLVVVAVSGSGDTDYCTVWINIRDVNDNAPQFTHERYVGHVSEQANITTYITRVLATDEDSGANGDIEYRLQGDKASSFFVNPKTGIITLARKVDREANEQIRVTVVAQDKGTPPKFSSSFLRITILDDNDNPPTFTNLPTRTNVKEDMQIGHEVYVVSALDPDSSPEVTFSFTNNPDQTFNIDQFTGRITLAKMLDHEQADSYEIGVLATDTVHRVISTLYVNVTDENDNAPVFAQSNYEVTIRELLPPNSPIILVKAEDADSYPNGKITYTLQGPESNDFYINSSTGWIYNQVKVLYSPERATVNLAVKATDGGVPDRSDLALVQIHIEDVNNFAPVFSETQSYTKSVSEKEETGVTILSVSAVDADDSPENKRITFSIIEGDPDGVFSMENLETNVGNIVLKKSLDREKTDSYRLLIQAADGGTPSKSTVTSVNITVSDYNDWPPVFINIASMGEDGIPIIKAEVPENISAGADILVVQATDNDIGENALLEYMITSGNDAGLFQIDQNSGQLSLAAGKTLDYELKIKHRMQVRAADRGRPHLSAIATVDVDVLDVNDNKPYFSQLMYLETVHEKQPSGTKVFTATAIDADTGRFGNLMYTLIDADANYFRIDSRSGVVTTAVEFRFNGKQTYRFSISAEDPGGQKATVQVQVQILEYEEKTPVFNQTLYNFQIVDLKNAKVGQIVGQVHIANQDGIGRITFELVKPSYYFNISRDEGIIRVKNPLDEKDPTKAKRSVMSTSITADSELSHLRRIRRSVQEEEQLEIQACMGISGTQCSTVEVVIAIPGAALPATQPNTGGGIETKNIIIIVVSIVSVLVIIVVVVIVVKTMRNCRKTKSEPQASLTQNAQIDSMSRAPNRVVGPPPYGSYLQYAPASHDLTDRSQCASSGRGSAEFDDEVDEEITNINTVPLHVHQRIKIMPDSGIQRDADTISEHSARDHQEYLARLGIDPKKIGGEKKALAQSVESMHQFSDEGGGEADPLDISHLYKKITEDGGDDADGEDNINQMGFGEAPAQIGSLSSVTDAGEEFTGSYNWDYLLNWGPQFQPLADVFAEIARLKDDTIQPKRKPVQTIPQTGSLRATGAQALKVGGPPPIITGAPPRVDSHRGRETNLSSARTSQLTSMVSLPHSPISHESSFSNLAFSPNFTPALSPLATRSPSVSTLQSSASRARSNQGSRMSHHNNIHKQSSNPGSDVEYRL